MSTKTENSQVKELRDAMFKQLKRLEDPTADLDKEIKRAEALTSVGNVIVNSVKVEVDFMRVKNQTPQGNKKLLGNGSKAE